MHPKQLVPDTSTDARTGRIDRLTIECFGRIELPEDEWIYGTYWKSYSVVLGVCTNLRDAVTLAERGVTEPYQNLVDVPEARGFSPHFIIIRDACNRLALGGEVRRPIDWYMPVASDEEARHVEKAAAELHGEAGIEVGWDNYCTAERLRREAQKLEARLVDPIWRAEAASIPRTSRGCSRS